MSHISAPQLRRLAAFAQVCTCNRGASRGALVAFLREVCARACAPAERDLLRELHIRLHSTPGASRIEDVNATPGMSEFAQLTARQRAATFLVLGLDYDFGDAALILGRTVHQVRLEVISAMFLLEHVAPARRPASAGRRQPPGQGLWSAERRGGAVVKRNDVRAVVRPVRERPDYGPPAECVCD